MQVLEHGALQDHLRLVADQAALLDRQYRQLQADGARHRVDADVAAGISEQQAAQAVALR